MYIICNANERVSSDDVCVSQEVNVVGSVLLLFVYVLDLQCVEEGVSKGFEC
jgi:hypothetical protein